MTGKNLVNEQGEGAEGSWGAARRQALGGWRGRAIVAAGIVVLCTPVYFFSGPPMRFTIRDWVGGAYVPMSLLKEFDFDLDEFGAILVEEYSVVAVDGHLLSKYPVGGGILALPVYAAYYYGARLATGAYPKGDLDAVAAVSRLSAAFHAAVSVAFVFFAASWLGGRRTAILVAVVYAFGTGTWSESSKGFWQHAPAQMCLAAALWALAKGLKRSRWVGYAGLAMSLGVVSRSPMLLLWIVMLAYVVLAHRREAWRFVALSAPAGLFLMWYQWHHFGAPWRTGYGAEAYAWTGSMAAGIAGMLVSPGRGLFVYSPVFLLCLVSFVIVRGLEVPRRRYVGLLWALCGSYVVLMSKWHCWWGGDCFGYRQLLDIVPALAVLLVPGVEAFWGKRVFKAAFGVLAAAAFGINALGAVEGDYSWNGVVNVTEMPEKVWDWKHGPIPYYAVRFSVRRFGIGEKQLHWYAVEPFIMSVVGDERWEEREGAARVLGEIGDRRAVEGLCAALSDPVWQVRRAAAEARGKLGDGRAEDALKKALGDESEEVQRAASEALARIEAAAVRVQ